MNDDDGRRDLFLERPRNFDEKKVDVLLNERVVVGVVKMNRNVHKATCNLVEMVRPQQPAAPHMEAKDRRVKVALNSEDLAVPINRAEGLLSQQQSGYLVACTRWGGRCRSDSILDPATRA
jgi:hypothetical protein